MGQSLIFPLGLHQSKFRLDAKKKQHQLLNYCNCVSIGDNRHLLNMQFYYVIVLEDMLLADALAVEFA